MTTPPLRTSSSRRRFLATTATATAAATLGPAATWVPIAQAAPKAGGPAANDQLGVAAIGLRYQGSVVTKVFQDYGASDRGRQCRITALCDVDRHVREQARAAFGSTPRIFEEYQQLLDRPDVDVVVIGTPDHWHSKMLIDAVRAGKDVYCEKPLTLTIDEGKTIRDVVAGSDRIVQVGTWQRSDERFRKAAEMVRDGRVGKLKRVTCATSPNPTGGPFATTAVPGHFNWNLWQGQTPETPFRPERGHYTFRWWYEYSGGKMTDWGAHHIDIAQWAIGEIPRTIRTESVPSDYTDTAGEAAGYNVAKRFRAEFTYPSGVELVVADEGRNGILFEGDAGRLFVSRGNLVGRPVEELASRSLAREDFSLYDFDNLERPSRAGKIDAITNHVGNLLDCIRHRRTPISDVGSQHRSVSTCHLGNIAMRLGDRPLTWNAQAERFEGDDEANAMLSRPQRDGFEVA